MSKTSRFHFSDKIFLDCDNMTLFAENGETEELTSDQFSVMYKLIEHNGHIVSREILAESLHGARWEEMYMPYQKARDIITDLRKVCHGALRPYIATKRGVGYRLNGTYAENIISDEAKMDGQEERNNNSTQLPHVLTNSAVPYADEQSIIHRGRELQELVRIWDREKCAIAISGFGGVGKTSIARILYSMAANRFDSIGWVDYRKDLKSSLLSSITLYEEIENSEERWRVLSTHLKNDRSSKLLIIDNVDRDIVQNQDPMTDSMLLDISGWPNMSVVLTSRLSEIRGFQSYYLPVFSVDACEDIFYHYYSAAEYQKPRHERFQRNAVRELVTLANNHTYAIELLARSAKYTHSLDDYLSEVRKAGFQFPTLNIRTGHGNDYATAAEQLRKLFDLRTRTDREKNVLWDFSVLPNVELTFKEIREWLGYTENDLETLLDEGWLMFHQGVIMHPLVKEALHLGFVDGVAPVGTAATLIELIANGVYFSAADSYVEASKKWGIAESALELISISNLETEANVFFGMGSCPFSINRPVTTLGYLHRALALFESLAEDKPKLYRDEITYCYNNIGYLLSYTNSGREDAEIYLRKALELLRLQNIEYPGKYIAEVATACDYLGYLLSDTSENYLEAETLLREAIEIRCRLEAEHEGLYLADIAWSRDNLGYLLSAETGRSDEAVQLLCQALETRRALEEENPGKYIAEVAWTCNNLAVSYQQEDDHRRDAKKLYLEALHILEDEEHRYPQLHFADIAINCNNLGVLYHMDGQFEKAEPLYRKALHIFRSLEDEYPDMYQVEVAVLCSNIAALLQIASPDSAEIESLFEDALGIYSALDAQHPTLYRTDIADLYFNIGINKMASKCETNIAEQMFHDAISIWKLAKGCKFKIAVAQELLECCTFHISQKVADSPNLESLCEDGQSRVHLGTLGRLDILYIWSGSRKQWMFCDRKLKMKIKTAQSSEAYEL